MKTILAGFVLCLAAAATAHANMANDTPIDQATGYSADAEQDMANDNSVMLYNGGAYYDENNQMIDLDQDQALMFRPGPRHPGPGRPGPGRPGPVPRPGPHPGPHPGPGAGWHPRPWHPGDRWVPHPRWHPGWRWDRAWHPGWFHVGIRFPVFVWIPLPAGYYQCTAFNQNLVPFSEIGPDQDQAAFGALNGCGGQAAGCYIPDGYCQLR